ncbi:hemin-degrading factor [Hoeflea sp. YIM 152468]|uniref:hemin-degrading factor n=1 Tax=Hoeflea sp. YIM 152468 TaxID=3031759 RepID=UPI0023DCB417|nr:ChuX/HutX family heme-like substrate-binding protein [Hoeflea sp. YIM 152468]MDF1609086.1 hemin-degrading factor [Hoeflea sp. YIM 152468]
MNQQISISAAAIRTARKDNPKMRERDLASQIGVCEAAVLEACIGDYVEPIDPDLDVFLPMLGQAGEVMALSRNDAAVHEKTGVYGGYRSGQHASIVLGTDIDLRIFPRHWRHAYHVAKPLDDGSVQYSFQFFDAFGDAVHKVFARAATDMTRWTAIRDQLRVARQPATFAKRAAPGTRATPAGHDIVALRQAWAGMQDTHQFQSILRKSRMTRLAAIEAIGTDFCWKLSEDAADLVLHQLGSDQLPVMIFLRNAGTLQIHSGPVHTIKQVGPWLNVLDPGFHLHLRADQFAAIWLVRKPTKAGDVYSLEIFGPGGEQTLMINGYRREGDSTDAVAQWNRLVQALPRAGALEPARAGVTVEEVR